MNRAKIDIQIETLAEALPVLLKACHIVGSRKSRTPDSVRFVIESDNIPVDAKVVTILVRVTHGKWGGEEHTFSFEVVE